MRKRAARLRPLVDFGAAVRPRDDVPPGGDVAVVKRVRGGVLAAVVDGIGTGSKAAGAAEATADAIRTATSGDLVRLVRRCHAAAAPTRGVAMSAAFFSRVAQTVTWLGIGGVDGRLLRARRHASRPGESLLRLVGVLGHDLPDLMTQTVELHHGDLVVLATDGVSAAFAESLDVAGTPSEIAERIVATHGRSRDDALALVVRYLGGRA
jgi:negative regulator of sigma-B (phosphoserine phosphatase)